MRVKTRLYVAPAILLATLVTGLLVLKDKATLAKATAVQKTVVVVGKPKAFALMPGDRLKLSFLEKLKLTTGGNGLTTSNTSVLNSFYERTDLSGEFEVAADGRISHPVLGLLVAEGKQLQAFEKSLSVRYGKRGKRPLNIRVRFVSRPPVYVRGLVGRPGAYRHSTGMNVSQVVALASGLYRGAEPRILSEALTRESVSLQRSQEKLARTLVQRSRVQAELAGKGSFRIPSKLTKLVGDKRAHALVAAENSYLKRFTKIRAERKVNWVKADKLAGKRIASMREEEKIARQQKVTIKRTINKYKARYRRSFVKASMRSQDLIIRLDMRQLDLQGKESKIRGDLLAAQQNKIRAERDLSSNMLKEMVGMKNMLEGIETEIINYEADISLARRMLGQIESKSSKPRRPMLMDHLAEYKIKRREGDKVLFLNVTEDSFVRPGDIVQVRLRK